jgi:mannosylglycerate hydrolase
MRLHVVPHTHWDREWYRPFEAFRHDLIGVVDEVLDTLEADPAFVSFLLDGQAAVVEDYLEVRPECADRVRALVEAGRLSIGPWYVLPDEFLVSPETHVLNIREGRRVTERFGGGLRVGYLPDQFGHISQMPQLLRLMGLDTAVLWRGVPAEVRSDHFWWQAPDGSRVLVAYLFRAYSNGIALPTEPEALAARLADEAQQLRDWVAGEDALLMNGNDHHPIQPALPAALSQARLEPGLTAEMSSLPGYLATLQPGEHTHRLPGELRSSDGSNILMGTLSSRVRLKQLRGTVEDRLERYASPLADLVLPPRGAQHLALARRALLLDAPHDTVCGCSADQVHEESGVRLRSALTIVESVIHEAGRAISGPSRPAFDAGPRLPVVWNPSARRRGGLCMGRLAGQPGVGVQVLSEQPEPDLPDEEWTLDREGARRLLRNTRSQSFGNEWISDLVWTRTGDELMVRVLLAQERPDAGEPDLTGSVRARLLHLVEDPEVTTFKVELQRRQAPAVAFLSTAITGLSWSAVQPAGPPALELRDGRLPSIGNDQIEVHARADGRIDVVDRVGGVRLEGLNRLVDCGDRGDLYNFDPPLDPGIVADAENVEWEVVDRGPVLASIRARMVYRLPVGLGPDRERRSDQTVPVKLTCTYGVAAGESLVRVRVECADNVADHRLRAHFPVPAGGSAVAMGHFDLVSRDTGPPPIPDWRGERGRREHRGGELPLSTDPCREMVVCGGLAVLPHHLREYQVLEPRGSALDPVGGAVGSHGHPELALTLVRSTGWLSRADLRLRRGHAGPPVATPGGQEPGPHSFEYAILPWAGGPDAGLLEAVEHYAYPLELVGTTAEPGLQGGLHADLEPATMVISHAGRSAEGWEVRFWNASDDATVARLHVSGLRGCRRVDLFGEPIDAQPEVTGGTVTLSLRPREIVTLELSMEE